MPIVRAEYRPLDGRFVRLEPFEPRHKDDIRAAIDCDDETWAILPENATGEHFESFWTSACFQRDEWRFPFAIRRRSDARIVGISSIYTVMAKEGGAEIGYTFLHPDARGGPANPESKLLLMAHCFASGAVRVQIRVDTRNVRSQAAVAKLGAVREGVLRRDRLTWTGYIRDTVVFSVLDREWPAVKARLEARLAAFSSDEHH